MCCAAVLLIQAVKHWYATHGPNLPANSKEKQAFRDILKSWQRSIEGVPLEVIYLCILGWEPAAVRELCSQLTQCMLKMLTSWQRQFIL